MNLQPKYYVYEWVRPDYNLTFYVGKGKGRRAWSMYNRPKHFRDLVGYLDRNGIKPEIRIIARFIDEQSSFDYEEERIAYFGLENLTNDLPGGRNGGGGMKGKKHSPETIERMCAAQKGRVISLDARRKLREANLGKKHSEKARLKMSVKRTGSKHPRATITEEIAKKIYSATGSKAQIARDFGVTWGIVDYIKEKKSWKHIHQN